MPSTRQKQESAEAQAQSRAWHAQWSTKAYADVGLITFPNWDREHVHGEDWEDALEVDTYWELKRVKDQLRQEVAIGRSYHRGRMSVGERVARHRARSVLVGAEATLTEAEWLDVLERFNGECAYCGAGRRIVMEHVVPVHFGGATSAYNIVPACWVCNAEKGRLAPEKFLALYPTRAREFERRVSIANGLDLFRSE